MPHPDNNSVPRMNLGSMRNPDTGVSKHMDGIESISKNCWFTKGFKSQVRYAAKTIRQPAFFNAL